MFLHWSVHLVLWFALIASLHAFSILSNGEHIFMKRCKEYNSSYFGSIGPQCPALWSMFSKEVSSQECFQDPGLYDGFVSETMPPLPEDKVMFWSGTKGFAHAYARENGYVTLEDTATGYIFDDVDWSVFSSCPRSASRSYWGEASRRFAQYASGKVTVLLNGSRDKPPAYNPQSIFAKYEEPELTYPRVTSLEVLLVIYGDKKVETCGTGSLVDLQNIVQGKGIPYSCQEISGSTRRSAMAHTVIFGLALKILSSN